MAWISLAYSMIDWATSFREVLASGMIVRRSRQQCRAAAAFDFYKRWAERLQVYDCRLNLIEFSKI